MSEIVNVVEVTPHNDMQIDFNKIIGNTSYKIEQTDNSLIISPNPYKQHIDIPSLPLATQSLNLPLATQSLNLPLATQSLNLSPEKQVINLTPEKQVINLTPEKPILTKETLEIPPATQSLNLPTSIPIITQSLNLPEATKVINLTPESTPVVMKEATIEKSSESMPVVMKEATMGKKSDSTIVSFDVDAGEIIKNDDILNTITGYKNIINDNKNFDKSMCLFTNLKNCDLNNDCVNKIKNCDINNIEDLKNSIINTIDLLNKFKTLVDK
jgi:hypothetical protein